MAGTPTGPRPLRSVVPLIPPAGQDQPNGGLREALGGRHRMKKQTRSVNRPSSRPRAIALAVREQGEVLEGRLAMALQAV
jgi:hypothetical protein